MTWTPFRPDCSCSQIQLRWRDTKEPVQLGAPENIVAQEHFAEQPESERICYHEVFCNASCNDEHQKVYTAVLMKLIKAVYRAGFDPGRYSPPGYAWFYRDSGPLVYDITEHFLAVSRGTRAIVLNVASLFLLPVYATKADLIRGFASLQVDNYQRMLKIKGGLEFVRRASEACAVDSLIDDFRVALNPRLVMEDGKKVVEWTTVTDNILRPILGRYFKG